MNGNNFFTMLLAQRLELNAIENALKTAGVLADWQGKEIRTQAFNTATAWTSQLGDDPIALLRVHSSPSATMLAPEIRPQ